VSQLLALAGVNPAGRSRTLLTAPVIVTRGVYNQAFAFLDQYACELGSATHHKYVWEVHDPSGSRALAVRFVRGSLFSPRRWWGYELYAAGDDTPIVVDRSRRGRPSAVTRDGVGLGALGLIKRQVEIGAALDAADGRPVADVYVGWHAISKLRIDLVTQVHADASAQHHAIALAAP
jgi:hypothetical protein